MPDDVKKAAQWVLHNEAWMTAAQAVFVVGSAAQAKRTGDSDIDFAVIVEGEVPPPIETVVDGRALGVSFYSARDFENWPDVALVDQKVLRVAGRLATGRLVYSHWSFLAQARRRWKHALLSPRYAASILSSAADGLRFLETSAEGDAADRLWALQGAAGSLAAFALDLSAMRFQKPKWTVHGLAQAGELELLCAIRLLWGGRGRKARQEAETVLSVVRAALDTVLTARRRALRGEQSDRSLDQFVRFTFKGATGLYEAGDFTGAIYTSIMALRVLLTHTAASPRQPGNGQLDPKELRRKAMRAALPDRCFGPARLARANTLLRSAGARLELTYKRRFRAAGDRAGEATLQI